MLRHLVLVALGASVASFGSAQTIRNYDVNPTDTAPVADGVVSPGEWDAAADAAGDWRELRLPFDDVDTDNNRFRMLYDAENLYILYETDYDFGWLETLNPGDPRPGISFGEENLNIYIDPNQDGDFNTTRDLSPVLPGVNNNSNTDGYQIAFNQYEGTFVSTGGNLDGIGFFTEGHVDTPFGDQASWNGNNGGGGDAGVFGSDGMVFAQNNSNTPDAEGRTGVIEIVIPFADLDANETYTRIDRDTDLNDDDIVDAADYTLWRDGIVDQANPTEDELNAYGDFTRSFNGTATDDVDNDGNPVQRIEYVTGLNGTGGVQPGDIWGFNMSQISRDSGENFLPIWNWHDAQSFALWPHGTITFQGAAGAAVPEPTTFALLAAGLLGAATRRR